VGDKLHVRWRCHDLPTFANSFKGCGARRIVDSVENPALPYLMDHRSQEMLL